jgi:nucleoside phosphorylase
MSLLYVFAASPMEGKPVEKLAVPPEPGSPGRYGPNQVMLTITGMGPRNAEKKADAVLRLAPGESPAAKPDAVLVVGLCGGLTEALQEGRFVTYSECRSTKSSDPVLSCSPTISATLLELLEASDLGCERVVGITSSRIATTKLERFALAERGATAVDMESYPILKAASSAGIPAAVLRVVSDTVGPDLPDFNFALNEAGGLDGRKALRVALMAPLRTARLLAANRRAVQRLEKALEIVLKAPFFGDGPSGSPSD